MLLDVKVWGLRTWSSKVSAWSAGPLTICLAIDPTLFSHFGDRDGSPVAFAQDECSQGKRVTLGPMLLFS